MILVPVESKGALNRVLHSVLDDLESGREWVQSLKAGLEEQGLAALEGGLDLARNLVVAAPGRRGDLEWGSIGDQCDLFTNS